MARRQQQPDAMIDRFWYSPGDGHVYVWTPGETAITVHRIKGRRVSLAHPGTVDLEPTGDRIPVPATVTATAMANAVDAWRDHPQG